MTMIVLVAFGASLAGFVLATSVRESNDENADSEASAAAGRQRASLGWRETYGANGQELVFSVHSLEVGPGGWSARLTVQNNTSVSYAVGDPRATLDRSFGLRLFSSGELSDLQERNESGTLPAVRLASSYRPSLPAVLEPGASWTGTISAPGSLAAGTWVRVVFGAFVSVEDPPDGLEGHVEWITDRAYRLRS
jgi:hypothetical protein